MSYFDDLTDYIYYARACRPGTKNVGWLESKHELEASVPTDQLPGSVWAYCQISIVQMRGICQCDL
jgi:hypothetical protein